MARRLVEAGVNLVQVNLGNNETWDTHGNAFPHLKDKLFPPTDRALSALLDDLHDTRPARQHARSSWPASSAARRSVSAPAAVLQAAGPRPLGGGADGLLRRRRRAGRHASSARPTRSAATPRPPADAGEHGRDDLPRARHPADARLARRRRTGRTRSTTASRSGSESEGESPCSRATTDEHHPRREADP